MNRPNQWRAALAFVVLPLMSSACASSAPPPAAAPAPAAVEAKASTPAPASRDALLPAVAASLAGLEGGAEALPAERKEALERVAGFVRTKRAAGETARLIFICTHNSRRSQMGQMWAAAAASYYGVDGVETFSGGLEVTAFNPRAIATLERAGFAIAGAGGDNPHVKVTYATNRPPIEAFSKKYSDPFNPQTGFVAVMTCSHSDSACPLVLGASLRVPLHYEDPKASDGTPEETATYEARSHQIATEMLYLFSHVKAEHAPIASAR
jgi:arsenate reductase